MKIEICGISILFLLINCNCNSQNSKQKCQNQFDLNSIDFSNEDTNSLKQTFNIAPGSYGFIIKDNNDWEVDKNDIKGYIYEKKDTATCISFFNEEIIANRAYTIYLNLDKEVYAYSLEAKAIEHIENNVGEYVKLNKEYLSKNLNEYESKRLFQNFPGNENILKFDFPNKIVMINYINNENYPNYLIIRAITKKPLTEESFNIIQQDYEHYTQ